MAGQQVNSAARPQTVPAAEPVRVLCGNFLFRPEYRLRKTDEFSSVFALRRTQRSRHFVIHHGPSGGDGARLGVVVAKRHLKHAHSRNLIKRLAREAFRHARPGLQALDIVLRLNLRPQALDRLALRAELDALLCRLRRQDKVPLTESAR